MKIINMISSDSAIKIYQPCFFAINPFKSISVSSESTDAFIKLCTALLLHLNDYEVKKTLAVDIADWSSKASEFIKAIKISKEFTRILNKFLAKDFDEDDATDLADIIKGVLPTLVKDTTVSKFQVAFIKDLASNFRKYTKGTWDKINRDVSLLNDFKLSAYFIYDKSEIEEEGVNYKKVKQVVANLVKSVTGKNEYFLTPEQLMTLRKSNAAGEKKAKIYSENVKILNKYYKSYVVNYIRSSKKHKATFDQVRKYLDKLGIVNPLATGCPDFLIDDHLNAYTPQDKQLDAIPLFKCVVNPKYNFETDNTFVLKCIERPRVEYRTLEYWNRNKAARFSAVDSFLNNEEDIRARWIKDMSSTVNQAKRCAVIVELLYSTASRVGGERNVTGGEKTYGLTTLTMDQISITKNAIKFDYVGKKLSATSAIYKIDNPIAKKVLAIMEEMTKDKKGHDKVFSWTTKGGKEKPLTDQAVRIYLKGIQSPLLPHGFRRVAGTRMAKQILTEAPFKKGEATQTAVDKWIKSEFIKIGEILNHKNGEKITGSTSIASYVDPQVLKDFYNNLNLRYPTFLPKK